MPPGTVARRALVIGYGNPLRGDDALGWRAALAMVDDPRFDGVDVMARHQLTPELALDIAAAGRVVFVDARAGAGALGSEVIAPEPPSQAWTHHMGAASLLGLAKQLYGSAPPSLLVTAPVVCLDPSERLSEAGERTLVELVELVAELLGGVGGCDA